MIVITNRKVVNNTNNDLAIEMAKTYNDINRGLLNFNDSRNTNYIKIRLDELLHSLPLLKKYNNIGLSSDVWSGYDDVFNKMIYITISVRFGSYNYNLDDQQFPMKYLMDYINILCNENEDAGINVFCCEVIENFLIELQKYILSIKLQKCLNTLET